MFLKKYPPSPAQKKIRWPPQLEIAGEVPEKKEQKKFHLPFEFLSKLMIHALNLEEEKHLSIGNLEILLLMQIILF